jgi:hypothetical protein
MKDFVARKVRTIELNKVQGTIWNAIKCKERLGNHPEAVIRQATINLYSRVWKSLGDSLPELYCLDLAEAYVTQESVSLRILCEEKGMICNHPMDICMRNLWRKAEQGNNTGTNPCTRFPRACCFEKRAMCARNMGAHVQRGTQRTKGMKKRDEKLDSRAAKKGAKKLVGTNCTKILEKESSD